MADPERGKGFSLRNKPNRRQAIQDSEREQASLPRPSFESRRSNAPSSTTSQPRSRSKPRQGGQTSDMIKKRYSIRYNQIPDLGSESAAPGMPKMPEAFNHGRGREASPMATGAGLDTRALNDPSLDAEQYVTQFLANASETDIQDYQARLNRAQNRASSDLQHSVYQNRTQFIKISKEAEKLKGEMRMLRGLMSELTTTLGQAATASGSEVPHLDEGARKRANRSSVANLEAMWSTQMQALWKTVEGSQKHLAAIPGRHIVLEQGSWLELDAATWKARRPVHIVLLNDHLLVATRKRKRLDPNTSGPNQKAPTKLVADHCWPLQDIEMSDLATGAKQIRGPFREAAEITNAVTVSHYQESFTYRNDTSSHTAKTDLLLAFKRTMDELRRSGKAGIDDSAGKSQETMNYLATRDPSVTRIPALMRTLHKGKGRPEMLIDVDGKQRNLRWVEGQIDELDIEVALQRFDEAVDHVEQLRRLAKGLKGNSTAQEIIMVKVDERASTLADLITQRLVDTHAFLAATQTHTSHLARLDFSARARTAYLAARTATLRRRARQVVFEGDVVAHITAVAFVHFTLVRNTVAVYQQCFPASMMSACVVWAKEQLDGFNEALARALSGVSRRGEVWRECLQRAREMAGVMAEVGVDFAGLVGKDLDG